MARITLLNAILHLLILCCLYCCGILNEFEFGVQYGIHGRAMSDHTIHIIQHGVLSEKSESLYLFGLMKFYGRGVAMDLASALNLFQRAAAKDHIEAKFALGIMYLKGQGVRQDISMAYSYLKACVDDDHPDAQWILATLFLNGRGGVQRDQTQAYELLKQSAAHGNSYAKLHLGKFYEYGTIVPQNFTIASFLYTEASNENVPDAMYYLGLMHAYGRGTVLNYHKAFEYFQKAASLQYAPAMYYLGLMYTHGNGIEVDYFTGLRWFEKAAISNDLSIKEDALKAVRELRELIIKVNARVAEYSASALIITV